MKISTKGKYGMHMMNYLAKNMGDKPIPLTTMAEDLDLPEAYLEQLMRKLRKAKFVKSVRGAHGGYSLSKKPDEIYVLEILDCLEDGTATSECTSSEYEGCGNAVCCSNRILWKKIDDAIYGALGSYSLQDLIDENEYEKAK